MKKGLTFALLVLLALGMMASASLPAQASSAPQELPQSEIPPLPSRAQQFSHLAARWTALAAGSSATESAPQADPGKVAYLTFDDGPDPIWTPQVLQILEDYHARATFYMIGKNARSYPEVIRALAEAGQTIGNHTYNHVDLSKLTFSDYAYEVHGTDRAIRDALSENPQFQNQVTPCLRPPYGEIGGNVYGNAAQLGYSISMWQLDTRDWAGPAAEEILKEISGKVFSHEVILMHDGGKDRANTVKALPLVLHELVLEGFSFQPYCTSSGQNSLP